MLVMLISSLMLVPVAASQESAFAALDSCFVVEARDSLGAGFLVDASTVVTAAHVVEGARTVILKTSGTPAVTIRAEVVHVDVLRDVAVLHLDEQPDAPALEFGEGLPVIGSEVFAIGSPIGQLVVSRGEVVAMSGGLIEATTPVDPGSSGGPLLDSKGAVVGLIIEENTVSGDGLAVPAAVVSEVLSDSRTAPALPTVKTSASAVPPALWISAAALLVALMALALSLAHSVRSRTSRPPRIYITLD